MRCDLAAGLLCLAVVGCGETKVTLSGKTIGGTGSPASSTAQLEAWMNSTRHTATLPTPRLHHYLGKAYTAKQLAGSFADALAREIRRSHHIGALGIPDRGHRVGDSYVFRLDVSGVMHSLTQYDCTATQRVVIRHGTSTVARSAFACKMH